MSDTKPRALNVNEGKCCDAAIRTLEARFGQTRRDLKSPEKERAAAPVELTCQIGDQLVALEHTVIEPFADFIRLNAEAPRDFEPLTERLSVVLPAEDYYELHLPAGAMQALPRGHRTRVLSAIGDWIEQKAPTLRRMPMYKFDRSIRSETPVGVPFAVSLHRHERMAKFPLGFRVNHIVTQASQQTEREARLRQALAKKLPKLAWWKQNAGARTVLVLEDNDIQLSNPTVIYEALAAVEGEFPDRPDEIHVVGTFIDPTWYLHQLRVDAANYYELSEADRCMVEFDPTTLRDLMAEV